MVGKPLDRRLFLAGLTAGGLLATQTANAIKISIGGDGGGLLSTKNLRAMINMLKGLEFSTKDEIALGEQLFPRLVAGSGGPYKNPAIQQAVASIATPIIETSEREPLPWQVVVVADSTINAWALPGGKLAINIGLLRYVNNEDELAAVIAHEMGHVENRHAIAQLKKKSFVEGLSAIGQSALNSELSNNGAAGYAAGSLAGELEAPMLRLVSSGYEKTAEFEADQQIPKSFTKTGHSVERGLGIFHTLMDVLPADTKERTSLYSSHPDTRERIAKLAETAEPSSTPSGEEQSASDAFQVIKRTFPTRRYYQRGQHQTS